MHQLMSEGTMHHHHRIAMSSCHVQPAICTSSPSVTTPQQGAEPYGTLLTKIISEGHTWQHVFCFCTQANALSTMSITGAGSPMSCACRRPSIAVLVATHTYVQQSISIWGFKSIWGFRSWTMTKLCQYGSK